jgi:hypothetical protein
MEPKTHPWRVVGIILLGLALMVCGPLASRIRDQRLDAQRTLVRYNLKLIQIALQEYFVEYKSLPFSPEGPAHALYKLKPYLDAECFDGDAKKPPEARAFWDDREKRLKNSDFFYVNEPSVKPDFARIVLMSRPGLTGEWVYVATGFRITSHEAKGADLRLLGSYQTSDVFLIVDFQLYHEWLRTHPDSLSQSGSHVGVTPGGANISIDYQYEGNRLRKCIITTDKGVIEETVELDDLGRITKLSRKPDHWESLLGE